MTQTEGPRSARVPAQLARFTGLGLWAVLIVIFAIWTPGTFLTHVTFKSIAADQAITAVLAIGVLFTFAAGQFDLSVAANLGLCAVIDAYLMVHTGLSPALAAVLTILVGTTIGLVNGLLVAYVGVTSLVATLGISSVLLALTELISNNQFIGPVPKSFQQVTSSSPLGLPIVAWYALVLAFLAWYLLEHTPAGRRFFAVGANAESARLAGVRVSRYVVGSFVITGCVAAFAGVLDTAKIGEVSSTLGPPYLLPAFAACFLGTTQLKLGRFNVWGTMLALYLLATGVKGLQLVGGQLWITDMFNGVALVAAVSVAVISQRRRGAGARRAGRAEPPTEPSAETV